MDKLPPKRQMPLSSETDVDNDDAACSETKKPRNDDDLPSPEDDVTERNESAESGRRQGLTSGSNSSSETILPETSEDEPTTPSRKESSISSVPSPHIDLPSPPSNAVENEMLLGVSHLSNVKDTVNTTYSKRYDAKSNVSSWMCSRQRTAAILPSSSAVSAPNMQFDKLSSGIEARMISAELTSDQKSKLSSLSDNIREEFRHSDLDNVRMVLRLISALPESRQMDFFRNLLDILGISENELE